MCFPFRYEIWEVVDDQGGDAERANARFDPSVPSLPTSKQVFFTPQGKTYVRINGRTVTGAENQRVTSECNTKPNGRVHYLIKETVQTQTGNDKPIR